MTKKSTCEAPIFLFTLCGVSLSPYISLSYLLQTFFLAQ
jgi:hypothetical protein